jgi:uncharacterized integral membrane protein (TIGR00698 family)
VNSQSIRFGKELALALALAWAALWLASLPWLDHFGGISLALVLGMFWRAAAGTKVTGGEGYQFAVKTLLRVGIVLLGTRLNLGLLAEAGPKLITFDLLMIGGGILFVALVLRRAGFEASLAMLTAVGTSICGASAIAAAAPSLRAQRETSALAIVVCTLVGTVATFLLISLNSWVHLNPQSYGVLAGSTLHEVAQVAAAVSPIPDAFQTGMLTKLTRVLFLAPVIAILPRFTARKSDLAKDKAGTHTPLVPWYVIGFLVTGTIMTAAAALPASVHTVIAIASQSSILPTNFLIAAAMGGIGLQINLELLRTQGLKLLAFAGAAWLVLFLFALALTYVW